MALPPDEVFRRSFALLQAGQVADAEHSFKELLRAQPRHAGALNLLAILTMQMGRLAEAEDYARRALKESPKSDVTLYNYGVILKSLGRPAEAAQHFSRALAINSAVPETWNNRGVTFNDLKRYREAVADFDKALSLKANYPEVYCNKGKALAGLNLYDQALAAYDNALALNPVLAEAWIGRGNTYCELKRYNEALGAYDKAVGIKGDLAEAWLGRGNVYARLQQPNDALTDYDKALTARPGFAEAWVGRGNVNLTLKRYDDACAAYDSALKLKPHLAEAWIGRGNLFYNLWKFDEAGAAYDKALALNADLAGAWVGRGNVLYARFRYDEAQVAYEKACALKRDLAEAWVGRGNVFSKLRRHADAFAAYDAALAIDPDLKFVQGDRLHAKQDLCDWTVFEADAARLVAAIREGKSASVPFALLSIAAASAADQLCCAKAFVADRYPTVSPLWQGERYKHDRIRVAYLSRDFREHPVSFLMAGMFECHDTSRFETAAISWGPDDDSAIRNRIKNAFERFINVDTQDEATIAALIREMEIDIVVDLMGFTEDLRTRIVAARPAPIQANYLGYVGTMGAPYIDYIIADKILIPKDQYEFYSEKIVCLPNSFQINDRKRRISDKVFTRAEAGLPQDAFVFCCFNNVYKITPDVFDSWMRILKQVDRSVLWLVAEGPDVERNLRSEVAARSVNPARLIFCQRLPLPEHQARLRMANVFLDTSPYNAGTTASDALWAGLPVVTRIGETLAGRMAASVLNAVGLPELIAATSESYEQIAVELAMQPEKMASIKRKLADNRLTTPLFDTKLFTKHIEAAYIAMYERYQAGLAPAHLIIPT